MKKSKAIIRIRGGLGNQLFQYVYGLYLEKVFDKQIYIDDSEFLVYKCHDGLEVEEIFDISVQKASYCDIWKLARYYPLPIRGERGLKYWSKMCRRTGDKKPKNTQLLDADIKDLSEKELREKISSSDVYMDGYWQDQRYINALGAGVLSFKKAYINKYKDYKSLISSEHSCSIHVRQGDYVGTERDICGREYYQKAIDIIKTKDRESVFYVFSDDLESARKIIGQEKDIIYIDTSKEKTAGLDLWLMSLCHNNIIPNSTFAWWASKLNSNPEKIIIMPQTYKYLSDEKSIII